MNLTAKQLEEVLSNDQLSACIEAQVWARGKTLKQALAKCCRGDWMMWLLRMQADKPGWPTLRHVVGLAGRIAKTALHFYEEKYPNDMRVRNCIQATQDYEAGKITDKELRTAANTAYAAADASETANVAAAAVAAAANTADYADAAAAIAAAANTADYAAAANTADYTKKEKLAEFANMIRKEVKF